MDPVTEIYDPVFVDASDPDFDLEAGWYIPLRRFHIEGRYEGRLLGAHYEDSLGPFESEREALLSVPQAAPGVLVEVT